MTGLTSMTACIARYVAVSAVIAALTAT